MPIAAKCPTCEHSYNVPNGQRGKRVKCRNCADIFVVGGSGGDDDDDRDDRRRDSGTTRERDRDDDRRPDKRDRERDDRDRPKKKTPQDDTKSLTMVFVIVGGVFLLLVVGGFAAIMLASGGRQKTFQERMQEELEAQIRKQGGNIKIPPINIPNVNNPNPAPRQRSVFDVPKNLDEAIEDLKAQGTDGFMRDARSNWLAGQAPVEARRTEVCNLLWDLTQPGGHGQQAAQNAFCKWAGPQQGDKVMALLDKNVGNALEAAARLKLAKAAAPLCAKLVSEGFQRATIIKHIETLGPQLAETEVLKLVNHNDGDVSNKANDLLKKWGTKPDQIITQTIADLSSPKEEICRTAIDHLAKMPVETARQKDVCKAISGLLLHTNPDLVHRATTAALVWGTVDMAPDLIQVLENQTSRSDRTKIMETLVKFNTEPCREAIVRQLVNPTNRFTATQIIRKNGAVFEPALIAHLKTLTDSNQKREVIGLLGASAVTPASIQAITQAVAGEAMNSLAVVIARRAILEIQNRPKP